MPLIHGTSRPIGAHFHVPHGTFRLNPILSILCFLMSRPVERDVAPCGHRLLPRWAPPPVC